MQKKTRYSQAKKKYGEMFDKLYKSDGIITVGVDEFPRGVYNICKAIQRGKIDNEALIYSIIYFEEVQNSLLHLMPINESTEIQFERYIPINNKLIKNYNKYKDVDKFELIKLLSE